MSCFFNDFVFNGTQHHVNITWEDDEPLFEADQVGKVLGMGNIHSSLSKFPASMTTLHTTYGCGGLLQKKTFLTEQGLYRLLFKSRKPVAEVFQNWVYDVIKQIRKTNKYELENAHVTNRELKKRIQNAESNSIMEAFAHKYLVYVAFIKNIDEKKLIKIGSTKDIKSRQVGLEDTFGSITFLKAFECEANEQFEKYLHTHKEITALAFRDSVHNGHKSSEVFLVNDIQLEKIYRIAKANCYKFRTGICVKDLETVRIKDLEKTNGRIDALEQKSKKIEMLEQKSKKIEHIERELADLHTSAPVQDDWKPRKFVNGPKIQMYSADGTILVRTYQTEKDALSDATLDAPSRTGLQNAIKRRGVYKGHRWASLDRDKDDTTIQNIGPTETMSVVHIGYVAMLNLDKTEIVNVFPNAKIASEDRKFSNGAAVSKAVKLGTKSGGHYFSMWSDCDETLKSKYLETHELPQPYVAKNAYVIDQIHPIHGNVLKKHYSVASITQEFRCGRATVLTALKTNRVWNGYTWRKVAIST